MCWILSGALKRAACRQIGAVKTPEDVAHVILSAESIVSISHCEVAFSLRWNGPGVQLFVNLQLVGRPSESLSDNPFFHVGIGPADRRACWV